MLLICPVRPGDRNEELRFALRTWDTNLIYPEGLQLLTVGYKPSWLKPDHHIEGNRFDSMPLAVFDNILLASSTAMLGTETALYMNDDFFCLDPVGEVLPVRRNKSLRGQVNDFPGPQSQWWPKSLKMTLHWLNELGHEDPYSFEVHRPLVADPSGMTESLSLWRDKPLSDDIVPQWRTAYGVLQKVEAYPVADAKLSPRANGFGTPWVSTTDMSWRHFGIPIRRGFQKPSRWEV